MITKALQLRSRELQERLFWIGSMIFIALSIYYCFSINAIVFAVANRKDTESNMHVLKSDIAQMELQYVALQNTITLASAKLVGLDEVSHPIFIGLTSKSLSIR